MVTMVTFLILVHKADFEHTIAMRPTNTAGADRFPNKTSPKTQQPQETIQELSQSSKAEDLRWGHNF